MCVVRYLLYDSYHFQSFKKTFPMKLVSQFIACVYHVVCEITLKHGMTYWQDMIVCMDIQFTKTSLRLFFHTNLNIP